MMQDKWSHQTSILERGGLAVAESGAAVVVASTIPHFIALNFNNPLDTGKRIRILIQLSISFRNS